MDFNTLVSDFNGITDKNILVELVESPFD